MHILIIHQAFASIHEPGGTRHHEFARLLTTRGYQVTVIASPISYITGNHTNQANPEMEGVTILRAAVYDAHHKSFIHRVIAFFSFMLSSFWIGLGVKNVDLVWGTSPPIFQGVTAWALARLKGAKFLFDLDQNAQLFLCLADCGLLRTFTLVNTTTGEGKIMSSCAMPFDKCEFIFFDQDDARSVSQCKSPCI